VPADILDLSGKDSDSLKVLNSMKWIDNNLMKVVNPEGAEKIVDVSNNFKEICFNVIPIFNQVEGGEEDQELPYYTLRKKLEEDNVTGRL
jgi:hypothetical protein